MHHVESPCIDSIVLDTPWNRRSKDASRAALELRAPWALAAPEPAAIFAALYWTSGVWSRKKLTGNPETRLRVLLHRNGYMQVIGRIFLKRKFRYSFIRVINSINDKTREINNTSMLTCLFKAEKLAKGERRKLCSKKKVAWEIQGKQNNWNYNCLPMF